MKHVGIAQQLQPIIIVKLFAAAALKLETASVCIFRLFFEGRKRRGFVAGEDQPELLFEWYSESCRWECMHSAFSSSLSASNLIARTDGQLPHFHSTCPLSLSNEIAEAFAFPRVVAVATYATDGFDIIHM